MDERSEEVDGLVRRKPALQNFEGVLFPSHVFFEETCKLAMSYMPNSEDVLIVSYPKSGTTWMQYIVWGILHQGASPPNMNDLLSYEIPMLELRGPDALRKLPSPRVGMTHIPFNFLKFSISSKYIYVARNPKDVCVSYYHHTKERELMYNFSDGSFDDFFECFLHGEVSYGDWFDHMLSWYSHKKDPNVLFLTYEGMKTDHSGTVKKVAGFLGNRYEKELEQNPTILEKIVHNTSFETMKKIDYFVPTTTEGYQTVDQITLSERFGDKRLHKVKFFRKGIVGDWKNYFSIAQEKRLEEVFSSRPKSEQIFSLWNEI